MTLDSNIPSALYKTFIIEDLFPFSQKRNGTHYLIPRSADNALHLPTTPKFTITQNGVSVTFEDYGSERLGASDIRSLLQQMGASFTHNRASQAIMTTIWELDYATTNLMMNYVPGPDTTWATYAIATDIVEKFWRDWDRVAVYFEIESEDRVQSYGQGFVATKETYAQITGRGYS